MALCEIGHLLLGGDPRPAQWISPHCLMARRLQGQGEPRPDRLLTAACARVRVSVRARTSEVVLHRGARDLGRTAVRV